MTNHQTRRVIVRFGFTECDTWRAALGPNEPLLYHAAVSGSLDAPENLPAGSMRASQCPSRAAVASVSFRN